jgi:two-component system phosphate regulon sensor histidine kinase PhoR
MQHEITRLSEMATGFLDLARIESGRSPYHIEHVDMAAIARECAQIMQGKAKEKEQRLESFVADCPLTLKGDSGKLKQVVLNLLSNAIKYTPKSGHLQMRTEGCDGEVVISIRDNGVGIPQESLPLVFEKFYRVPTSEQTAQGSGLGLFICKRIVEAHLGKIEVESKVGEGTCFTVHLPRLAI